MCKLPCYVSIESKRKTKEKKYKNENEKKRKIVFLIWVNLARTSDTKHEVKKLKYDKGSNDVLKLVFEN